MKLSEMKSGVMTGHGEGGNGKSLFKMHPDNDHLIARVLAGDPAGLAVMFEATQARSTATFRARYEIMGILPPPVICMMPLLTVVSPVKGLILVNVSTPAPVFTMLTMPRGYVRKGTPRELVPVIPNALVVITPPHMPDWSLLPMMRVAGLLVSKLAIIQVGTLPLYAGGY